MSSSTKQILGGGGVRRSTDTNFQDKETVLFCK